jgi:hypothetical protein
MVGGGQNGNDGLRGSSVGSQLGQFARNRVESEGGALSGIWLGLAHVSR